MDTWRARVEAELKGADFERTLVKQAYAGVAVQPVYGAGDAAPDAAMTGSPFRRGRRGFRSDQPWIGAPRYDMAHPKSLQRALLADLQGGVDGLWLQLDACARLGLRPDSNGGNAAFGDGGCMLWSLEDWRCAFEDVRLGMVHVDLDAGSNTQASLQLLLHLLNERGESAASFDWNLGLDPLGSLARDGALPMGAKAMQHQFGDLVSWAQEEMPKARALMISTEVHHHAGASLVQEIGIFAATFVHYLQLGDGMGLSPREIASTTAMRLVMDRDLYPGIAGLRAARLVWSRILEACGVEDVPAPWIHAIGSRRSLSRRDPWTNQLRASTQTFAAILGGAQKITTCAFDEALGQPSALGRRVARNTQIILAEESRLGDVADPAGGSYLFESLTDELAEAAWDFFQEIEAQGGMAVALRGGWLASRLAEQASSREEQIATRRIPITGVSSFPPRGEDLPEVEPYIGAAEEEKASAWVAAVAEQDLFALTEERRQAVPSNCGGPQMEPLPQKRDAAVFEELIARVADAMQRGALTDMELLAVGSPAQAEPRLLFAETLFASAGLPTRRVEKAGNGWTCLCGSEAGYREGLASALEASQAAGVSRLLVCGRPQREQEQAACTEREVAHFLSRSTHIPNLIDSLMEVKG
ncbi:MAG: methylmalonyl-CoA mutase family protein [Planctomycetota bacterium]|jgi:methylmalonyl-CoA mutase